VVVEMVFGLFKSKPEKDLDKIVEKISVASEKFLKAADGLTSVSQQITNTLQAINRQFEEIRKELNLTNARLDEYVKKMDNLKPIGLNDVLGALDAIYGVLKEISGSLTFGGGMYTEPLQSALRDIEDAIDSLRDEIRYSKY
jgi:uncharacterized phage infection (PIP) family protein YhgE